MSGDKSMSDELKECRQGINEIDEEMAKLFEKRMNLAKKIAAYKKENGLPVRDPKREEELIKRNTGFISDEEIRSYYVSYMKSTLGVSCDYQEMRMKGMKVAYGGAEGAFANIAAKKLFPSARLVSMHDFTEAYKSVEYGENDCAVLPIENSMAGEVGTVLDLMFQGSLYITNIYELPVTHNLLGLPGTAKADIKKVISHPQALAQCSRYLSDMDVELLESANTSAGARFVANEKDKTIAAIASVETAEVYGLEILGADIQNAGINTTRFAVFSRCAGEPSKTAKNSEENFILMFTVKNEAGALAATLNIIGAHGINMKSLKSRPLKSLPWNYYFYMEAEGNIHSRNGAAMMQELSALCDKLKLVGSFKV